MSIKGDIMKTFSEWIKKRHTKYFFESVADDATLWKYYEYVKKNPNLDDLKTLLSMIQQSYGGKQQTGVVADFMGGINYDIIPKLPQQDQEEAKKFISNLNFHSQTNHFLQLGGNKNFNDLQEFEDFLIQSINNNQAAGAVHVAQDPKNKYWWEMTSGDIKKQLLASMKKQLNAIKNQPSIGDIIKKTISDGEVEVD
jgi:hypothetical protein